MSQLNLIDNEWASFSNENESQMETLNNSTRTSMVGFISFLITMKTLTLIFYVVLFIISVILLDSSFFYTILSFGIAEVILIGITIFHVVRPTLGVVFFILAFEMCLGMTKVAFAIALDLLDGGKDCSRQHCSMLSISSAERFGLFWFCLATAFYDYFLSLVIISNSPQMHEFEMGDDFLF